MIHFIKQKLLHKKWMVVSLLIGNILLIAIACSNPMYQGAALQKIFLFLSILPFHIGLKRRIKIRV